MRTALDVFGLQHTETQVRFTEANFSPSERLMSSQKMQQRDSSLIKCALTLTVGEEIEIFKNSVFWDVTPCGSCNNRRLGGT
jgi:hypothetical protein